MTILQRILSVIAPHSCVVCGREGGVLCLACRVAAPVRRAATCYRCNRISDGGKTCPACRRHSAITGVLVASYYEGAIKELIQLLKYERVRAAAPALASVMSNMTSKQHFDVVTWVPVATHHYRRRGYNQAELIARSLGATAALPYRSLLRRNKNIQQVGRSRQQRLQQVQDVFMPLADNLTGQRILIVDDVLTTGATLNACAAELRKQGATQVWGIVAAKH